MKATPEGSTLAIGGTPTELGNFSVAVTVIDSAKPQDEGSGSLPIEVAEMMSAQPQGTLKLDDSLSVTDTLGDTVDIGSAASGGIEPYTWTVTGLPSGVKASAGGFGNAAIGLTGVAAAPGTYPFTVTLSDSGQPQQTVTEHYTLTVLAPNSEQWSTEPLSSTQAIVGTPYSGSFGVNGQTNGLTVTWTLTAGSLPPGLSLNSATGTITGTPTETGLFVFTIIATNAATGASKTDGADFTVYPAGTSLLPRRHYRSQGIMLGVALELTADGPFRRQSPLRREPVAGRGRGPGLLLDEGARGMGAPVVSVSP
jgi:hypothetical protein